MEKKNYFNELNEFFDTTVKMYDLYIKTYNEFFSQLSIIRDQSVENQSAYVLKNFTYFTDSITDITNILIPLHQGFLEEAERFLNDYKGREDEDYTITLQNDLKSTILISKEKISLLKSCLDKSILLKKEIDSILSSPILSSKEWSYILQIMIVLDLDIRKLYAELLHHITNSIAAVSC